MNILFLSDAYRIGGGERNLIEITKKLIEMNNDVVVCIPKYGILYESLLKSGIECVVYGGIVYNGRPIKKIIYYLTNIWTSRKIIRELEKRDFVPDIIHSNNGITVFISYILATHFLVPLVWTCHGPWEAVKGVKAKLFDKIINKTIAITQEIYNENDVKSKTVIPLGIQLDDLVWKKDIPNIGNKILCVARFQKIKGQDVLVKAFKILQDKLNIELHFYGGVLADNNADYKYMTDVKKYVDDNSLENKIFFHEYDPYIRKKMQEFTLLCIPSYYESFSVVALEGMNCGIHVVAPRIGGPQFIIQDGVSGVLFEPGNVNDLAEKIYKIMTGKIRLKSEKIKKRAKEFSIERQASKTLEVYFEEKNPGHNSISTE